MWISLYPFSPWQIDLETFSFKEGKGIRWVHRQQMGFLEKASDLINSEKLHMTRWGESTFVVNVCWSHQSWCYFGNSLPLRLGLCLQTVCALKMKTQIIKAVSTSQQWIYVLWKKILDLHFSAILVALLSWHLATVCGATDETSKKEIKCHPNNNSWKILIYVWWLLLNVLVLPSCSHRTYWCCR